MPYPQDDTLKRCATCMQHKPVALFDHNRARPDGWQKTCRECNAKQRDERKTRARSRSMAKTLDRDAKVSAARQAERDALRERIDALHKANADKA
jgi:hypothetical protein